MVVVALLVELGPDATVVFVARLVVVVDVSVVEFGLFAAVVVVPVVVVVTVVVAVVVVVVEDVFRHASLL